MDKIYIYEDEKYRNLLPIVYLRPVFDLYCGIFTFRERIQKLYPQAKICSLSRFDYPPDSSASPQNDKGQTLFISGRAILHSPLPDEEGVFVAGDEVIGFRIADYRLKIEDLKQPMESKFLNSMRAKFKSIKVKTTVIKYPWDLIKENERMIIEDYKLWAKSKNIKIEQGVFLNEDEGPVCIGKEVKLRPPTIIDGPCYIGEGSLIDGAKIRRGTTIGKYCRIGGEVEQSIFSDFSNKHHEGFIGHSYIGEWVNLGALTTTSDLKNTYGTVKVPICMGEVTSPIPDLVNTGLLKLGAFIGDHTKTGIGTLLDTGSVIGCFANIYGGGVAPKYIPSFSWGTKDRLTEYNLDKAIEVAKIVIARRGKELTEEYESIVRQVFELTRNERRKN